MVLLLFAVGAIGGRAEAKHGDVKNFTMVQVGAKGDMAEFLIDLELSMSSNPFAKSVLKKLDAKCGVKYFHVAYESRDAFSNPVVNTAALLVPAGNEQVNNPTIIYNHGTVARDSEVPTASNMCIGLYRDITKCNIKSSAVARASLWAMNGYAVLLPDFEKLGEQASNGYHPYCQRESFVKSTEDLLLAIGALGIEFDRRLVVAGYSEGGYAALAIQRGMDLLGSKSAFRVIASFPHAGPVDWKYQVNTVLEQYAKAAYSTYWYVPYTIIGALQYRNRTDLYEETFLPQYKSSILPLYNRKYSVSQIEAVVPKNGSIPFTPGLANQFLSGNGLPVNLNSLVVKPNILFGEADEKWVPKAPVFFCSGTDDEQVPVENSHRAAEAFRKNGVKVQVDLFAGDHTENAQNCLLVLTRYISTVNWDTINDDKTIGNALNYSNLTSSQLYTLYAIIAVLAVGILWRGAMYWGKCPGPMDVWLNLMVSCPSIVFLFFVAAAVGISVFGLYESGWGIEVDTDFANYLDADSDLKFMENAVLNARADSKVVVESSTKRRRRNLRSDQQQQSLKYWSLDIFYEATDNVFTEEALEEIRMVEAKLYTSQGYQKFCHRTHDAAGNSSCIRPDSVVNIFYPEIRLQNGTSNVDFQYNGKGTLTNIDGVLKTWVRSGVFWYADKHFAADNLISKYTRSRFYGGLPLQGYSECCPNGKLDSAQRAKTRLYLESLYTNMLTKLNYELQHVQITWQESRFLTDFEVNEHLLFDAKLSLGSFLFVALFIYFHMLNIGLTVVALFGILMSFPMAYCVFYVVAKVKKMIILNFVALFLIMGIGADDIFVLYDAFQQSKAVLGRNASLKKRMKWAYRQASSAMLITTATTMGSFYANMFSSVRVVREFGLFMGTVTAFNFLNVMTIFPAYFMLAEKYCTCKCCRCGKDEPVSPVSPGSPLRRRNSRSAISLRRSTSFNEHESGEYFDEDELQCTEKVCRKCVAPCISKYRWSSIIGVLAATVSMAIAGVMSFKTSTGPPVVFLDDLNVGRLGRLMRETFGATRSSDLDRALSSFPKYGEVVKKECPGLLKDGVTSCSGKGFCDTQNYLCTCTNGYAGPGCSREALPPVVNIIGPKRISLSAVDGGVYSRGFQFENRGDTDLIWSISATDAIPSWISFPGGIPRSGRLAKLTEAFGGRMSYSVQSLGFQITVSSQDVGFSDSFEFDLSSGDTTTKLIVVITRVIAPLLSQLEIIPVDALCTVKDISFQKATRDYRQALPFACSNVIIRASVESSAFDAVVLEIDGVTFSMQRGDAAYQKSVAVPVGETRQAYFVVVTRTVDSYTLAQSNTLSLSYAVRLGRDAYVPTTVVPTTALATTSGPTTIVPTTSAATGKATTEASTTTAVRTTTSTPESTTIASTTTAGTSTLLSTTSGAHEEATTEASTTTVIHNTTTAGTIVTATSAAATTTSAAAAEITTETSTTAAPTTSAGTTSAAVDESTTEVSTTTAPTTSAGTTSAGSTSAAAAETTTGASTTTSPTTSADATYASTTSAGTTSTAAAETTTDASTTTAVRTTTLATTTTIASTTPSGISTLSPTTFAPTTTLVASSTTSNPTVAPTTTGTPLTTTLAATVTTIAPQARDDTLQFLAIDGFPNAMRPAFQEHILIYNATIDSAYASVTFIATANSSLAIVSINGDSLSTSVNLDYVLSPQSTMVSVKVVSQTGSERNYYVNIRRERKICTPSCGVGGECNGFDGTCDCKSNEGYTGNDCSTYCPGQCNGHGACVTSGCECDSTYSGPACTNRECPICNNSGTCAVADWSCECPSGWRGDSCSKRACVNDCNGVGDCNDVGICLCFPGYSGNDCGTKAEVKVPLEYTITVEIVFGIIGYDNENKSQPLYYQHFDVTSPESQLYLHSISKNLRNISSLKVRPEVLTWIEAFKTGVKQTGYNFPVSSGLFSTVLDTFFSNKDALKQYQEDLGVQNGNSDDVKWASLQLRINADKTEGYLALQGIRELWVKQVQRISAGAPATLGPALLISSTFTKIDTEYGIIFSTVASFLISNGICFACVLVFTTDWKISIFVLVTINFIVITLLGFLFSVMGYTFGAIEAIGVTIFVGMSVDYSLHLAHAFHHATGTSRKRKLQDALTALGVSILGGAITTGGASIFLLFCRIYLFVQLGVMMLMNTLTAFTYTLFGLCAFLVIAGPVKHCICIRICERDLHEENNNVAGHQSIELHLNPVLEKSPPKARNEIETLNSWAKQ